MSRFVTIALSLLVALVAAPAFGANLQSADAVDQALYRGSAHASTPYAANPRSDTAFEGSARCDSTVLVHNTNWCPFIGPGGHKNIPSNWKTEINKDGTGQRFYDPTKKGGDYVRMDYIDPRGPHVHVRKDGVNMGDHVDMNVFDTWGTWSGP